MRGQSSGRVRGETDHDQGVRNTEEATQAQALFEKQRGPKACKSGSIFMIAVVSANPFKETTPAITGNETLLGNLR